MLIRLVKKDDYDKGLLDLYRQLTIVKDIAKNDFVNYVDTLDKSHNIYVIEEDGSIVGTVSYFIEKKLARGISHVLHVEDLVVDKKYRGRSFATLLLSKLNDVAKEYGCYKKTLFCNREYVKFYEKNGYLVNGVQMAHYFNPT